MPVKVKICGVTNREDATWAVNLGASFIGFNFWEGSPRKVSEKNAQEVISNLPLFVSTVGVFVNAEESYLETIVRKTKIHYIQLHGDEDPAYCESLKSKGMKIIKAFRLRSESEIDTIMRYRDAAEYFLLDTFREDVPGGTGQTFNWDIARMVKERIQKPFFLAGGLTPENVYEAAEKVMPFGVDVCSGIEKSPRRKDYEKMKEFIMKVNEVF